MLTVMLGPGMSDLPHLITFGKTKAQFGDLAFQFIGKTGQSLTKATLAPKMRVPEFALGQREPCDLHFRVWRIVSVRA